MTQVAVPDEAGSDPLPLRDALRSAAADLARVQGHLDGGLGTRDDLDSFAREWSGYYLGSFRALDDALRSVMARGRIDELVALSISHHNLDRLMQVLTSDETAPGGAAERVLDLTEGMKKLTKLMTDCASL